MSDSNSYDLSDQQGDFRELLNDRRKSNKSTDVELDVGGKLFPAHRDVISLYSPVLEAAVSDHWSTTRICPISEEYVDVVIMEDLLNFLYTGKIKLTPDNAHPVCVAAHFLQIPQLLDIAVKHLCKLITVENVFTLFQFSTNYDYQLEPLRESCLSAIRREHETVLQDSRILEFSFNDFKDLIIGLKNYVYLESAEVFKLKQEPYNGLRENTFHCIVIWFKKNLPERLEHLPILFENIPLEDMSHMFLEQVVSNNELVMKDSICSKLSARAISATKAPKRFILIGGQSPSDSTMFSSIKIYDPRERCWSKLPNMSVRRTNFAATVVNQRDIVICGGMTPQKNVFGLWTTSVEMFQWKTKTWKELPNLPEPLKTSSMTELGGNLYVIGETILDVDPNKFFCYSFKEKRWRYLQPSRKVRHGGQIIAYKDSLYVLGGKSNTIEKYDSVKNQWQIMTETGNDKELFSGFALATLHQDKIYVLDYNCFGVYDPEENVWTLLKKPKRGISTTLVSLGDELLAVGGSAHPSSIYEIDISKMKWTEIGRMDEGVLFHQAVTGDLI